MQTVNYSRREADAVYSVLIEMGQVLGEFLGEFVVMGGVVPSLLLDNDEMPHIGTTDLDICLDPVALAQCRYVDLVECLLQHRYEQESDNPKFQLVRTVHPPDGGSSIDVIVDFLMPRNAKIERNRPPHLDNFAVIRASGAELVLLHPQVLSFDGTMPDGTSNQVSISIASIPAFLVTKGFALQQRDKPKDAYDIYYCVRNFCGGPSHLSDACQHMLDHEDVLRAYSYIDSKFATAESYGPRRVGQFLQEHHIMQDRTLQQWERDAFGQVEAWLRKLGIRD